MTTLKTRAAAALALAGALAVSAATPSFADDRWAAAGIGFAAGALVGAAAANANAYYGPGYAYHPGHPYAYGYAPGYVVAPAPMAVAPAYVYTAPAASFAYSPAPMYGPEDFRTDPRSNDPDPRIGASLKHNKSHID